MNINELINNSEKMPKFSDITFTYEFPLHEKISVLGHFDDNWYIDNTGQNLVWYMGDTLRIGYGYLPAATNTNWAIRGEGKNNLVSYLTE